MVLSSEAQATVERWQRSTTGAAGLVRRGQLSLRLAAGHSHAAVGRAVGVQRTVRRPWAQRFLAQRLDGLADAPGRGATGGVPRRSRSTWDASPANVRSRWAAAAPRGMAPNWPAHASLRAWWRVAPPRPYGGCWLAITANPGAILSGGRPNTHAMPPGRHPSRSSATSTPVSCLMPRGSGQVMRTPPDPLGLVSRLGGPLTLGSFPTAMRMHRSAGGP